MTLALNTLLDLLATKAPPLKHRVQNGLKFVQNGLKIFKKIRRSQQSTTWPIVIVATVYVFFET
jgi:hypothetical protein